MPNKEEIKRRVERAQQQFAAYSARLQEEQRNKQLFPSTLEGGRGPTSPLGGTAEFPWGPEKKGD
jgi:hypothetical protein